MPPAMTMSPPAANRASPLSAAANRAALTTVTSTETAASVHVRAGLPIAALRTDRPSRARWSAGASTRVVLWLSPMDALST
ncbi:hypothetical protein GCM10010103_09870 [Streptomyces paradoxus]